MSSQTSSTSPSEFINPETFIDNDWRHLYDKERIIYTDPMYVTSIVVHGFGRGSKELGIPTANLNMDTITDDFETGIYFSWALLNKKVYAAVISIGYNPVYKNSHKTIEAHIIDQVLDDFYGQELSLMLFGYLRNERNFPSLESLVSCIKSDIHVAKFHLNDVHSKAYLYRDINMWREFMLSSD